MSKLYKKIGRSQIKGVKKKNTVSLLGARFESTCLLRVGSALEWAFYYSLNLIIRKLLINVLGFLLLIKFNVIRSLKGHMKELHLGVSQFLLERGKKATTKNKEPGLFSTLITHTTALHSAPFLWQIHIRLLKVLKVFWLKNERRLAVCGEKQKQGIVWKRSDYRCNSKAGGLSV